MSCRLKTFVVHRGTCTCVAALIEIAALVFAPADAAPVAVRLPEGVTHGFLLMRSSVGEIIGQGEMIQVVKEGDPVERQTSGRFSQ